MAKISELDIRLGMKINTPEGIGCIESANRRSNIIEVAIDSDIRKLKSFKIEELSIILGQIPPSVTQEVGDIALISSKIEQRLKDFLFFVFNLKNAKQKLLLIQDYSIIRCLDKINEILNDYYTPQNENLLKWKDIYIELQKLIGIRNNIIHGSMYNLFEEYIFSNSKKIKNIKINPDTQVFTFKRLFNLTNQFYEVYYKNMFFLNEICVEIKEYLT